MGKGEIAHSPFSIVFSTRLENFLQFQSNLKLSSASNFRLEESIFFVWERVKNASVDEEYGCTECAI